MTVKQVIFDLGGVLVEWNPPAIAGSFTRDRNLQALVLDQILLHPDWSELDRGAFSESQAAARMSARSGLSVATIKQLFDLVRRSLTAIEETVGLLDRLADRGVPCYGLSNMSPANYTYLVETHDFFKRFREIVVSGHEKIIKPDPAIYRLACDRFQLVPGETLFLDDSLPNITAAQDFGLQAMHFNDRAGCIDRLNAMLL